LFTIPEEPFQYFKVVFVKNVILTFVTFFSHCFLPTRIGSLFEDLNKL